MADDAIQNVDPSRLADLLRRSGYAATAWQPEELQEVFRHQLSAPVEFDLGALPVGSARTLRVTATAKGLLVRSFEDLLRHPAPPLELLKLTKEFAKAHLSQPDSPLPREIALVLYFSSIAVAYVRCRERISNLSDAELRAGFAWGCGLPWIDAVTRAMFDEAIKAIEAK